MIHQEKEQLQIAYEKADMESKTKTEFMNRMSHDLRTPINGILAMIQVIRKSWNNQEKLEDSVDKIEISTRHLMDIMMPVMNGIEVARNIRRKEKNGGKEIPIIAMTAQSERESKESCSLAGMNAYISKPVDPENLIRILRMYQKR